MTGRPVKGYKITNRYAAVRRASEQSVFLHERGNIVMLDPASMLDEIVAGEKILGIIVPDALKRAIFPFFGTYIAHDGRADLNIRIFNTVAGDYEIAFEFSDSSDADIVSF